MKVCYYWKSCCFPLQLVIHRSSVDDSLAELGSGVGVDDTVDITDEPMESSGGGASNLPITYIDDEDYQATGNIKVDFECETFEETTVIMPTVITKLMDVVCSSVRVSHLYDREYR